MAAPFGDCFAGCSLGSMTIKSVPIQLREQFTASGPIRLITDPFKSIVPDQTYCPDVRYYVTNHDA